MARMRLARPFTFSPCLVTTQTNRCDIVAQIIALLEDRNHAKEIKDCLEAAGYKVSVHGAFPDAKLYLQTNSKCDLIISDVHLENGGNVFDFLRWAKGYPPLSAVPFVLLSLQPSDVAKYLRDGVRVAARHLGAAKYIDMEQFDAVLLEKELSECILEKPGSEAPAPAVSKKPAH